MTITFGSLFSGIGGLDLGLELAGMQCKWQVEIDPFCQKVLTKHWPHVPKYRDIRECGDNLESVDLICGGFPCQPFSVAGKQRGKDDDRYLWPEMLRIIKTVRPAWVVGENVPGIIRMGLDQALSDLEACGYSTRTFGIPSCALEANHTRMRIFIIAHNNGVGMERVSPKEIQGVKMLERRQAIVQHKDIIRRPHPHSPVLCRSLYAFPSGVDRVRAIGNAVDPVVAEFIGRMIMEFERNRSKQ